MPSERRLTVESALAVVLSHLVAINYVIPWAAQWLPALALDETETTFVPSFSSLRFTPVGHDFSDPGLWLYLGLVWLGFGSWVYLRRHALQEWGRGLLADSELDYRNRR